LDSITPSPRFRIGIDVGGTFTDLFLLDQVSGAVVRHKLPSTPGNPHLAPLDGVRQLLERAKGSGAEVAFVGLGTTVATNALLERKGAVTGLITTAGFRDLLELARQKRPHTFDLNVSKREPLVPRQLRAEVPERIAADGSVLTPLDREALRAAIDKLLAANVESIAICFLHAYHNAAHEETAAALVRERWPDGHVAVSSEVLPEFREYERLSSTVINAYLMPATRDYFHQFERNIARLGIAEAPFVMNSGGGVITPAVAAKRPLDTLFSGPSGGVSGAVYVAERAGYPNIITFDMGGTSTDVCLVRDGRAEISYSRVINGYPLKAAALDVHTVGAGGSSIARVDEGGMLRVGPASAGSQPGPACYGRGGELPTVTDANVVLGRLNPEYLLAGALKIDAAKSRAAIEQHVAKPKGLSLTEAAAAILAIADTNMAQALRFVSVERGLDPGDFMLMAFGGAGPLHAASVARQLGVAGVLVPYAPGVLCAMGVLTKDMQMDFSRTRVVTGSDGTAARTVAVVFGDLESRARAAFAEASKADPGALALERTVDARYAGQNHELSVAVPAGALDAAAMAAVLENFHRAHEQLYGYRSPERALELVTFRVKATLPIPKHDLARVALAPREGQPEPVARRQVYFDEPAGFVDCPVYARDDLRAGDTLAGPAVVEQMDTTTVIPPRHAARVDAMLNLLIAA
jgi:N-methylhydantoinase A